MNRNVLTSFTRSGWHTIFAGISIFLMQVIDGVMKQLLSRDLMYEPTKQICEKFPEWLATNK